MKTSDPSDMYSMIANYPKQFAKGFRLAEGIQLPQDIKEVVIAGIGGSALAPDIVISFFKDELSVPITVHRSYSLPPKISDRTLVIAVSFSGNTEETLSATKLAYEQKSRIVAVTSGGALELFARERALPLVLLTKESDNFQPRMSSGYVIAVLTQLLINAGVLSESARQTLLRTADAVGKMYLPQLGKNIAALLPGYTPLIYASDRYWPVARIAKIKINENSKVPCSWNVLPEMNHNEMVGFTNSQGVKYFALVLQDPEDDPRINRRMGVLTGMLQEKGIKSFIVKMPGTNKYERTIGTLMLMDWVSYWLALELGIDPTPVDIVEEFKAAMAPGRVPR